MGAIRTKVYVITGAPSSGKQEVIQELGNHGFYTTSNAGQCLMTGSFTGVSEIESPNFLKPSYLDADYMTPEFQARIVALRKDFEKNIPLRSGTKGPVNKGVFHNGGLLDYEAYCNVFNLQNGHIDLGKPNYNIVFVLQGPVGVLAGTGLSEKGADVLYEKLVSVYREHGYKTIEVPEAPLEKKVEMILAEIGKGKART